MSTLAEKGPTRPLAGARLGAEVSFVAKIGNDSFGDGRLGLYRNEGIDVSHVQRTSERADRVGFITVEASTGHNCIVLDPGANELLNTADVIAAGSVFKSAAVVLTQLEIPVETAHAAMAQGRAQVPSPY